MPPPRGLVTTLLCCLCCGLVSPFVPRRPPPDLPTTRKIGLRLIAVDTTSVLETSVQNLSFLDTLSSMDPAKAEALAGPFFGLSLFPYLGFLYLLNVDENNTPKGVVVGFATCLLFVFLTIPAAIAAKLLYGVSLADSDWLHGSAESLLTITNLVTVVAFRQALGYKQEVASDVTSAAPPESLLSYDPMAKLVGLLTFAAFLTAFFPAIDGPAVHTPYLGGFMDIPSALLWDSPHPEPDNALTVATWIIHISSLVEFLVAMGFCWRWADIVDQPRWKGLTWGLLPLHTSGIVACTSHLFYNSIPILVPLQAFLTCVGNTTAGYAAWRVAVGNGWRPPAEVPLLNSFLPDGSIEQDALENKALESQSLVGFEDLGEALAQDNDATFIVKLFAGCAVASYAIKYGEVWFDFPFEGGLGLSLAFIFVPSLLNAYKWYRRGQDPTFDGWF